MTAIGIEALSKGAEIKIDLGQVWNCVAESERSYFWKFATKDAQLLQVPSITRRPAPRSPIYDGLCTSIRALERNGVAKPLVTGLPKISRRLAPEALSKGVARFREKLLDHPESHLYVISALCRWVQASKLAPLISIMEILNCRHDEKGELIGAVPTLDADHARVLIQPLINTHRIRDLSLVCGALMLNHGDWSFLHLSFDWLKHTAIDSLPEAAKLNNVGVGVADASEAPDAVDAATAPVSTSKASSISSPSSAANTDSVEDIEALPKSPSPHPPSLHTSTVTSLREQMTTLGDKLQDAILQISAEQFPEPKLIVEYWLSMDRQITSISTDLGVRSRRLSDIQYAIQQRTQGQSAKALVLRCQAIRHVSDENFAGTKSISDVCERLSARLDIGDVNSVNHHIEHLLALLKLVDEPESINDDAASTLSEIIREGFGHVVATAALRGKLTVAVPTLRDAVTQEQHPRGAEIQPSEDAAVQAELTADPDHEDVVIAAPPLTAPSVSAAEQASPEECISKKEIPLLVDSPTVQERDSSAYSPTNSSDDRQINQECDIDFAAFRKSNWLNNDGVVSTAPWADATFLSRIAELLEKAWADGELGIAYLFSKVATNLGVKTRLDSGELFFAERLLEHPTNTSSARNANRVQRIRDVGELELSPTALGLSLVLEAVGPTYPFALSTSEITNLVNRADYSDPALKAVVAFLLNGWASTIDPIDTLRTHIHQVKRASPSALAHTLSNTQECLRNEIAAQWSAAGGRLKHTHSRKSWTDFMRLQVGPLRDELAPLGKLSATPKWSVTTAREKISQLGKAFQRIMDAAAVKHQDRVVAIHAAEQIVASIERVVDAMQRIASSTHRSHTATFVGIQHEDVDRLFAEPSTVTLDNLCTLILRSVLQEKSESGVMRLAAGFLVAQPNLIRALEPSLVNDPDLLTGIPVSRIAYPEAAAALLLNWETLDPLIWSEGEQLMLAIRNAAADDDRWDLLAALSPTTALQAHERTLLHRRALSLGDEAFELARKLERTWGACDEMLAPGSGKLKALVDDASRRTANGSIESPIEESMLLHNWISRVLRIAERERDFAIERHVKSAFLVSKEIGEKVKEYFCDANYRAAVALLHRGEVATVIAEGMPRRTEWRQEAIARYTKPRTTLATDLKGHTTEQSSLVNMWAQGDFGDPGYKDTLRRLLYQVISGEAGRSQAENQRRFPVKLSELREHRDKKTIIHCAAVREYFRKARLNPTFLPQLADFQQIVLTSSASLSSSSANFLDSCSKAAAQEGPGSLVVFLEPGVSESRRDELCSGLRRRGVPAALLDDIDLCRLCAVDSEAEAHNFIPFLEVIFEQLDLESVSPFSSLDGQHVRIETYIGRVQAAQQIALGWSYTRVFSGRKLGKSAFLRHVSNTYNGERLPSGNKLNVFFITIAGGESEVWVVNYIIDEMTSRFALSELEASMKLPPAERFSRYMKRFMQTRPNDNVLLILDEADSFVEGQLASYNENREGSLSFRMMKELPSQVDSSQMPRVRIVFSGYRVTNTRGGVWANAGDVLVLKPLAEDEAVQFLRGMFARIGVDIRDHAPFIARRCGFQPAVLIRFGENLLKRLKRGSSASRETLVVSLEEVRATMNEQSVLDEIRTVVNNNFQGNRFGAAIFGATLLALKDLQPGMALADGPAQVLEQLIQIDGNLDWLERLGSQPLAQVERQLQDFIERELLTVSDAPRFGVREYRLKFPHFLPVLTQQTDVTIDVSQQIQLIRAGTAEKRMIECVLPDSALDVVRYWFHQETASDCAIVVVGSQWSEALLNEKCGLPDRLGINRHSVARNIPPAALESSLLQGFRLFGDINTECWTSFLTLTPGQPLIAMGGVDLLRLAKQYVLAGGDTPIDVVALGRMPDSTLSWWFESARSLHFKTPDAVVLISKATQGIPMLVASFDSLLNQAPASDVTTSDLEVALKSFSANLSALAQELVSGSPSVRISARELELLSMAIRVGTEVSEEFDLERDFAEYWAMCEHGKTHGLYVPPMSDPGDRQSLEILTAIGLLHATTSDSSGKKASVLGSVRIEKDGVIARMLTVLEAGSAR